MNKYNLSLIAIAVVLILGNVVYLWSKYQSGFQPTFSEEVIKNHPSVSSGLDETVADVREKAKNLPEGTFLGGPSAETSEAFQTLFDQVKTDSVFRIKVWDRNYTVLWSNSQELIGKSFPDNHELEESLEGEIEVEIKKGKSEHLTERAYSNYSELYIPIANDEGEVVGVIETYKVIEDVVSEIRNEFYASAALSLGLSIAVFLVLAFVLRRIIR